MRVRSTWNQDVIKQASMAKQADPYLMNQDHVSQNPPASKYMNGTPSSWAEDVHSPNSWEAEYAGGQTKRNEIGEAAFRPETFNHQEHAKSASEVAAQVTRKADLACKVARLMLRTAAEGLIEDQALALMSLPDEHLFETHQRLAQEQTQEGQGQGEHQQQAAVQPVAQEQGQQEQEEPKQQQANQQEGQGQSQQGMHQQQSAAYQTAMQQCIEAMGQGDENKAMSAIQQMVQEQMKQNASQAESPGGEWGHNNPVASTGRRAQDQQSQGQGQGQGQQKQQAAAKPVAQTQEGQGQQEGQQQKQQAGMQNQQAAMQQQLHAMIQQATQQIMQQQQGPQGQQDQQFDMQASDNQLLDNVLAPQAPVAGSEIASIGDVELEAPTMDMGEITLTAADDVLNQLFASQETEDAQQAKEHQAQQQQYQQGQGQQHQASVRHPSARTVGTRPTAGVSRVGGTTAPQVKTAAGEVEKLTNLWSSAPDVREVFGLR